jgi:hypothetical protein
MDAHRISQLMARGLEAEDLLETLLDAARDGLSLYTSSGEPYGAADHRLAFRELGLAIGLHALARMRAEASAGRFSGGDAARARLDALARFLPLATTIERFWLTGANQRASTWTEHRDINEVMLATSLAPDGMLVLAPP